MKIKLSYSSFPAIYHTGWIDNESHAPPGTIVASVRFEQGIRVQILPPYGILVVMRLIVKFRWKSTPRLGVLIWFSGYYDGQSLVLVPPFVNPWQCTLQPTLSDSSAHHHYFQCYTFVHWTSRISLPVYPIFFKLCSLSNTHLNGEAPGAY